MDEKAAVTTTMTDAVVAQARVPLSNAKAKRIAALIAEIKRLQDQPDVVAFQATNSFLGSMVSLAAEETEQQIPPSYGVKLEKNGDVWEMVLTAAG